MIITQMRAICLSKKILFKKVPSCLPVRKTIHTGYEAEWATALIQAKKKHLADKETGALVKYWEIAFVGRFNDVR